MPEFLKLDVVFYVFTLIFPEIKSSKVTWHYIRSFQQATSEYCILQYCNVVCRNRNVTHLYKTNENNGLEDLHVWQFAAKFLHQNYLRLFSWWTLKIFLTCTKLSYILWKRNAELAPVCANLKGLIYPESLNLHPSPLIVFFLFFWYSRNSS